MVKNGLQPQSKSKEKKSNPEKIKTHKVDLSITRGSADKHGKSPKIPGGSKKDNQHFLNMLAKAVSEIQNNEA
eukprot:CAMPEP_0170548270 /NCGR_PEP_ID=MMETSP0211-20121228/6607_1 /TAXON_ID=311385 /ORGANISM="Pseudokeronopsis sp., Strain OXSARD2" /LENGTH=72 /DNA_ID=CAMNT_0010853737 /DNA_START=549 /DNA_END=767 /DNA_ORIENTATION=-